MKRHKNGQFKHYITPDQWTSIFIAIGSLWIALCLGFIIGYIYAQKTLFLSPIP